MLKLTDKVKLMLSNNYSSLVVLNLFTFGINYKKDELFGIGDR
jgi:hypothetical protein